MLDETINNADSDTSVLNATTNQTYQIGEFLAAHHQKIMDHLQKALLATGNTASEMNMAPANSDELLDVALAKSALDDLNERNSNLTASVILSEINSNAVNNVLANSAGGVGASSSVIGVNGFFNPGGNMTNEEYEQFLADLWVGIVLTLMVLSCVCCMCSCLLYHKFQQWKRTVLENRARNNNGGESGADTESLPSYTIASGLPSYEEALEQLKTIKNNSTTLTSILNNSSVSSKELESVQQTINQTQPAFIVPVHQTNNTTTTLDVPSNNNITAAVMPALNASMTRLSVVDLFQIYRSSESNNKPT